MFEHSVRVPRHFKIAANIVKKVSEEGGSVKTLLYDNKLKHFRTSVLYALINETIKHAAKIEKLFEKSGILINEPRLDIWLAKVLTAELLYGKKSLPGKSKPEQTILTYRQQFEILAPEVQDDEKSKVVRRPRYVRINTILLTTSDAIRAFQDEGYKFIRCTSGSYNDYLQQIQNLTEYDFTQDYHVKTIFVFPPSTKMHEHDLYWEHKIVLQDKATALAVHLLAPPPGSVVLDMCAAPGMKTTQLAAYMRNQGKIYAVERNEKRYETLCEYVEATGSKCVETLHKDSLEIKRGDLDEVEYILLDPSCSGSGMELSVHNYIDETRLAKLTSLQEKFLKHAMNAFPNAKRIVYSTCSVFPEENERVVTNIAKASRARWRVKDIKELLKDQWNNFGSGMYGSIGTRCIYAKPDTDFTIGFFLAVLDRDLKENEISENDKNKNSSFPMTSDKKHKTAHEGTIEIKEHPCDEIKNKKSRNSEINCNAISTEKAKQRLIARDEVRNEHDEQLNSNISGIGKLEKNNTKIKVKQENLNTPELQITEQKLLEATDVIFKNKKKKRSSPEQLQTLETNILLEMDKNETEEKKKKRKKHKVRVEEVEESTEKLTTDMSEYKIRKIEFSEFAEFDNEIKKRRKKRKADDPETKNPDILENFTMIENQERNLEENEPILKKRKRKQKEMVGENDLTEKEGLKVKKKKQKVHKKELEECVINSLSEMKEECDIKFKKKNRRDKSDLQHSDETQLSFRVMETINCDKSTKKLKKSVKHIEISDTNEVFKERSKKKKKKRESNCS